MNIRYTNRFVKKLKKAYNQNPKLRKAVVKQVKLFKKDPYYPSLRTHKLTRGKLKEYSFRIEGDLRITLIRQRDDILFTDLITHDEY